MRYVGIGCRQQASMASLQDVLTQLDCKQGSFAAMATSLSRSTHSSLMKLAVELELPLLGISPELLAGQCTHTQSIRQQALFGTGSLAEAAALAAAGADGQLLVTRRVSADGMATAAVAFVQTDDDATQLHHAVAAVGRTIYQLRTVTAFRQIPKTPSFCTFLNIANPTRVKP